MSYNAGEARLALVPDATRFKSKAETDLRKIQLDFAVQLGADTSRASQELAAFRAREAANAINLRVDVDADTTEFRAQVERAKRETSRPVSTQLELDLQEAENRLRALRIREQARKLDIRVEVEADPARAEMQLRLLRAREEARRIELGVDVDTAGAQAKLAALRLAGGGGGALGLNAGLLGLNLVPGAALGITQLAGAVQQLVQAALVVPGVIGGAVAAIGTLAVGFSGVKDAYDAASAAAEDSGESARQATAAQNAHRNAAVDNAQAHKDLARAYRDARQEITDLNIEVNGGVISEKQAINDALRARRDLATGRFQDGLDYADAQLRVEAADQRVVEAHQRNIDLQERVAEANARGVAGSDLVVAARERLIRSEQALAEAQANAAQGSLLQQKAAEEMARLAPNAREFVEALRDTKNVRSEILASAQQPLFAGLAGELHELTDSLVPTTTRGLSGIATALNQNIRQLMQSVGSDNSRGLLDRILGNTAEAQSRATRAIDPLVRGVGTLIAAGSDKLPRLTDAVGSLAERLANFIETADKDGRLDRWIDRGLDGFTDLGNIVLHLGKSITAVTEAVGGPGLLANLEDLTGRMAEFLNSTEGQQEIREFFQDARTDLERWRPILESLPGLVRGLMEASRQWAAIILPPLGQISTFLAEHPTLIAGVVVAFTAWKSIAGVASLIDSLNKVSTALSVGIPAAANKGADDIAAAGDKAGKGFAAKIQGALRTAGWVAIGAAVAEGLYQGFDAQFGTKFGDTGLPGSGMWFLNLLQNPREILQKSFPWMFDNQNPQPSGGPPPSAGPDVGQPAPPLATNGLETLPGFGRPAVRLGPPAVAGPPLPFTPPGSTLADPSAGAILVPGALAPGNPTLDQIITQLTPGYMGPRESGGPTPSGRGPGPTGGWLAEIHDDEWILPKHARRTIGDRQLWEWTKGRRFQGGGYVDQYGNPVTPGAAPGPAAGGPQIAPNPYQGGGVPGILGSFMQGIQGPIGNAMSLGGTSLLNNVPGVADSTQHGLGTAAPAAAAMPSLSDRMASVPGLWGLVASATSSNPAANVMAWGQQTANWLGGWASNTLTGFGSALWQGALGVFGLEKSILSPNNPWNQAGQQAGQFFLSQEGPFGALLGGGQGGALAAPGFGQRVLQLGDGSTLAIPTFGSTAGAAGIPGTLSGPLATPGALTALPTRLGGEGGLQINTINVKRAVEAMFPQIQQIGGYRKDALKWHPNGLAIDVMIPGGDTHGGANPQGKALGDQIYAYVMAHKEEFGIDYVLWQTDSGGNHYNHLHINTTGGGYPDGQGAPPGAGPGAPAPAPGGNFYSNWYPPTHDSGGRVPPGLSMVNNRTGGDEFILNRPQALEAARALEARRILPTPPPRPGGYQEVPDAKLKQLPGPVAAPEQQPVLTPPSVPSPAAPPATAAPTPVAAGAAPQIAPATPGGTNHNLKAVDTAISSGASTLGNIASMAVQAAAAAATMGGSEAAAAIGGMGAGAAGSLVSGLFQQAGKIASDVVNVGSSFLVGSVPGSFGGPAGSSPYGQPVRAEQNAPVTAPTRVQHNTFHGLDPQKLFQQLDVRDAQAYQAELANK